MKNRIGAWYDRGVENKSKGVTKGMKTFLVKVEVDDEVEFEDIEQLLDNSMIVTDVDLMEVYED